MSNSEGQNPQGQTSPINIMAQYVRDQSFENPNTPDSLRGDLEPPEMDINIGMDARKIPDDEIENLYEVVLSMQARAIRDGEIVFIVELQYGITVQLNGIPEENHHAVLLIEVPTLAFPYARMLMSEMTVNGGYPPLMLNPVDFRAMYMERFKEEIAEAEAALEAEEQAKDEKPKAKKPKIKPKKEKAKK